MCWNSVSKLWNPINLKACSSLWVTLQELDNYNVLYGIERVVQYFCVCSVWRGKYFIIGCVKWKDFSCHTDNLRACFPNSSISSSRSLFFGMLPTKRRWLLKDMVTPIFLPLRSSESFSCWFEVPFRWLKSRDSEARGERERTLPLALG